MEDFAQAGCRMYTSPFSRFFPGCVSICHPCRVSLHAQALWSLPSNHIPVSLTPTYCCTHTGHVYLFTSDMGKLPVEGGGRGTAGARPGSRVFATRGGVGVGSPATSLSTADEKTRRISRQHTVSKGSHPAAPAVTPSLGEGSKERFQAMKSLFKPYQVGGCLCYLVLRTSQPRRVLRDSGTLVDFVDM